MTAEAKRDAVRSAWLRRNGDRVPFFIEAGENLKATRALLEDPALDLASQERLLDACAGIDDDSLPSLKPNLGIGVMAAAFGCAWVPGDTADPWVKPIITDDNPGDALRIPLPDPLRAGLFPQAFQRIEYFQEHGRYPLRFVNIPSPLLTASLVWEYGSFLAAMQESPKEAHALLEKTTAATLVFLRTQRERIHHLFAYTHESVWIPPEVALRLSDDVAAVLNADLYREFGVRYNNAFADEFGGLVIHSCGDVSRTLPAMMETRGLIGLDLVAPQNDAGKISACVQGRAALCLRFFDWDFPVGTATDLLDYGKKLVDHFGSRGTLLWTHVPSVGEAEKLARGMRGAFGR